MPFTARLPPPHFAGGDDSVDELTVINVKAGIITMANCAAVLMVWYK